MCDKRDSAITCQFWHDLHSPLTFSGLLQKICLKKSEVWRKVISTKLLSRSSQKVCRLLFSAVLLRKFPIRKLKQRRFWATHVNRKWAFLPFYMPWRWQICIAKFLFLLERRFTLVFQTNHCPVIQKVHFRLTSVAQKRCCLRSLLSVWRCVLVPTHWVVMLLPPVLPCGSLLLTRHLSHTHLLARGLIKD